MNFQLAPRRRHKIKWPWHRHRWGPWRLSKAVNIGNSGNVVVTVQTRQCQDPSCRYLKIEGLNW